MTDLKRSPQASIRNDEPADPGRNMESEIAKTLKKQYYFIYNT
ncbi:hypothetical protein ACFL1N_00810 [Thermodesulfobacteriota bacterium]